MPQYPFNWPEFWAWRNALPAPRLVVWGDMDVSCSRCGYAGKAPCACPPAKERLPGGISFAEMMESAA